MPGFGVTRDDVAILEAALKYPFDSGIRIESKVPGVLVPDFYVVAACNAANYRYFDDWQELSPEQQTHLVAHYMASKLVKIHGEDAQTYESARKQQKTRARTGG